MALTTCPDCKRELSSTAAACPHCGHKPNRSSPFGFVVALLVLSASIAFFIGEQWGVAFFLAFGGIGAIVFVLRR